MSNDSTEKNSYWYYAPSTGDHYLRDCAGAVHRVCHYTGEWSHGASLPEDARPTKTQWESVAQAQYDRS